MTFPRSKIRKFLFEYFNDNELTNLCFDYFPLVENNFTLGMGKDQKIRELIVYCENRKKTADLLATLERERPDLYAELLKEAVETSISTPRPAPIKPERNTNQIFLSHSSDDAEFADQLAEALRQNGWEIWMAPDSIFPGEKWAEAINRGLEESGIFLLLMTEAVLRSRWVKSETNFAIEMEHKGEMRFIPLAHDNVELPPLWRGYQWIPFSSLSDANITQVLAVLDERSPKTETSVAQQETAKERSQIPQLQNVGSSKPKIEALTESAPNTFYGLPVWSWVASSTILLVVFLSLWFSGLIGNQRPNANNHEWIEIPAGSFLMGSADEDSFASDDEKPQHPLSLQSFLISKYETTNEQYKVFIDAGHGKHVPSLGCNIWRSDGTFSDGLEDHPVVCVTWYDAIAYAEWLATETGEDIRLPSEAEWEKAARGELGFIFPWGNEFEPLRINCNFDGCPGEGFNGTLPVGSFPDGASPYGVEDMASNVWEWTRSYYTGYPYVATDGRENVSLGEGFNWVLRGGSFLNTEENFRGAHRIGIEPGAQIHDFGFRVVNFSAGE